jgi:hypothetical protein
MRKLTRDAALFDDAMILPRAAIEALPLWSIFQGERTLATGFSFRECHTVLAAMRDLTPTAQVYAKPDLGQVASWPHLWN